jgi:hypothetical protein
MKLKTEGEIIKECLASKTDLDFNDGVGVGVRRAFEEFKRRTLWEIQIHKEKIDEYIVRLQNTNQDDVAVVELWKRFIREEYESIMILEAGLEDVI